MLARLVRHLLAKPASRTFTPAVMERIAGQIHASETRHRGEICFTVESDLPLRALWRGVSARDRAIDAFARLRVWDTAANNGVLIYLNLAEHRIEIVADRGLTPFVSAEQWRGVCQLIEERLAQGEAEAAVGAGIEAITRLLELHFPQVPGEGDEDELPNRPVILR